MSTTPAITSCTAAGSCLALLLSIFCDVVYWCLTLLLLLLSVVLRYCLQLRGIEEAGDEAEGGIENIDVGLVFYKIFNFVSAESWSWFGIVHSAVIGATSNIPIRRATTFAIHAINFQCYHCPFKY